MMALFEKTKCTSWYITTEGNVYSRTSYHSDGELRLKPQSLNRKRGYNYIRTSTRNYIVHRLVASAFIPNPLNKMCVNHKNSVKTDNRVENLEWVTHKENTQHAIVCGRIKPHERKNSVKYSDEQCRDVLRRIKDGLTYVEAGRKYNMPYSTVAHLVRGSRRLL